MAAVLWTLSEKKELFLILFPFLSLLAEGETDILISSESSTKNEGQKHMNLIEQVALKRDMIFGKGFQHTSHDVLTIRLHSLVFNLGQKI